MRKLNFEEHNNEDHIEKIKQAIYEKIVAENNFNVFADQEFPFENEGDDEFSSQNEEEELMAFNLQDSDLSDDQNTQRRGRRRLNDDELVEILDDDEINNIDGEMSPTNGPKFLRKSTMATVETRTFMKNTTN